MKWLLVLLAVGVSHAAAQETQQPHPVFQELHLEGATIFTPEDVVSLLNLRQGSPLPASPADVARTLREAYERDGYSEARVAAALAEGRLTLTVDEGRIDEIDILGVSPANAERLRRRLGIKPGDIYNTRIIGRATRRLETESQGAIVVGQPRRDQPGETRPETAPSDISLERRGARNVLIVPLRWRTVRTGSTLGSGREDLFSPVDGLSPSIGFSATIFDHNHFNHTYLNAYASYKFGRGDPGYSAGVERPLFGSPKLFLGAEVHDMTASDDLWRITSFEQTIASVAFKNTFRDYYRRRGGQLFSVLRMGPNNELSVMARWDRHAPLANATGYSFFRDDSAYRANPSVEDRRVDAAVLGYTFDTRPLSPAGQAGTYERHVKDSLFGQGVRQRPGLRLDWTSEIAGPFDRHILNLRGGVMMTSHTMLWARGVFGFSNGTLPVERLFSIGGIGSVHGYGFKEAAGTGLALANLEYRVILPGNAGRRDSAHVFAFYDAGRITGALAPSGAAWLHGVGFGAGAGGVRVEFGFRADAIPRSRQILVRYTPTF